MARSSISIGDVLGVAVLGVTAVSGGFALGNWLIDREADRKVDLAVSGQLNRICGVLRVQRPPLIATTAVPNAATDGTRVFFNRAWFRSLLARHCCADAGCRVAVIAAVMAHELGHMAHRHVGPDRRHVHSHDRELEADRFAGAVLRSLGLSTEDFEHVLGDIAEYPSDSHPESYYRIEALREGYFWGHSLTWGGDHA